MSNRGFIILGGVAVVVVALACMCTALFAVQGIAFGTRAGVSETIATELAVDSPATLNVINPVGDVTVEVGRDGVVEVRATKHARSILGSRSRDLMAKTRVQADSDGRRARIDVELPSTRWTQSASVDLAITVPHNVQIDVVNHVGDIRVSGVEGDLRLRSDVGDIEILDVVVVEDCDVGNGTGNVEFQGRLPERAGTVLLRTKAGNVSAMVPADSQFALDAQTKVGEVRSELELGDPQSGRASEATGHWLRGGRHTDANGVRLVLRAETGDIEIGPLP